MNHLYWYYTKQFTEEQCEDIIEKCSNNLEDAVTGLDSDAELNQDIRKSKVMFVTPDSILEKKILELFHEANKRAFGFSIYDKLEVQFTEYDENYRGFYNTHIDCQFITQNHYQRKISMVVFLTNKKDYKGGEFKLWDLDRGEWVNLPEFDKGDVIVFPSFLPHKVTPVTKGKRNTLVTWIEGEHFR